MDTNTPPKILCELLVGVGGFVWLVAVNKKMCAVVWAAVILFNNAKQLHHHVRTRAHYVPFDSFS
jgi:hypothetical protein